MIRKKLITIVALTAMVGMIQTAQAVLVSVSSNLGALAGGANLSVGDKTFSGFTFQAVNLSAFNANNIIVTASYDTADPWVYYLSYGGNMQLSGVLFATADLLLTYNVVAGNPIAMIDQRYTGGVLNGSLLINETATSGSPTVHSQLSVNDVSDPNTYPGVIGSFDIGENDLLPVVPPQTVLHVTKDLGFTILDGNPLINGGISQVSVSLVEQSFHQVPEPTTMIAGALLLLPFGASTLRILRRNRTA